FAFQECPSRRTLFVSTLAVAAASLGVGTIGNIAIGEARKSTADFFFWTGTISSAVSLADQCASPVFSKKRVRINVGPSVPALCCRVPGNFIDRNRPAGGRAFQGDGDCLDEPGRPS